eukprot:m.6325 g.6325  ORF g.6325 m.6325 type:complete len:919 (+) comp3518_c0_seq1:175-2931(+)
MSDLHVGKFEAVHLQSDIIQKATDRDIVTKFMESAKDLDTKRKCYIDIYAKHITFIDKKTKESFRETKIPNIKLVLKHPDDPKLFCFTTFDGDSPKKRCHVFLTPKADQCAAGIAKCFGFLNGKIDESELVKPLKARTASVVLRKESVTDFAPKLERRNSRASSNGDDIGTYKLEFVGEVAVEEEGGDRVVEKSLEEIKACGSPSRTLTLLVTADNLQYRDFIDDNVVETHFIRTISYLTLVKKKKHSYFAYILRQPILGYRQCYVFECAPKSAVLISEAVNKAFKLAKEMPNPFAAEVGQTLIKPPQSLAKAEIRRQWLRSTSIVGTGQFGEVHLAELDEKGRGGQQGNKTTVAVKMLKVGASADDRDEFVRECEALLQLEHPRLCTFYGVSVRRRPWLCIIEYIKYGDVRSVLGGCLSKNIQLRLVEFLRIGVQVADGMRYVCNQGWVHMDLAARNVLVGADLLCKVADFGMARRVGKGKSYKFGSDSQIKIPIRWSAPDAMFRREFSEKTDVWAYGVTMWEVFEYGMLPYKGKTNKEVQELIRDGQRLKKPENCPQNVYDILMTTWKASASQRLTFDEIFDSMSRLESKAQAKDSMDRDICALLTTGLRATKISEDNRTSINKSDAIYEERAIMDRRKSDIPKDPVIKENEPVTAKGNPDLKNNPFGEEEPIPLSKAETKRIKKKSMKEKPEKDNEFKRRGTVSLSKKSVGERCKVTGYESEGVIRFVGEKVGVGGLYVLVELDEPEGDNDGNIDGHMYAICLDEHGVFVKPSSVKLLGTKKKTSTPNMKNGGRKSADMFTMDDDDDDDLSVTAASPAPRTLTLEGFNTGDTKDDEDEIDIDLDDMPMTPMSGGGVVEGFNTPDDDVDVIDVSPEDDDELDFTVEFEEKPVQKQRATNEPVQQEGKKGGGCCVIS